MACAVLITTISDVTMQVISREECALREYVAASKGQDG